MGLWKKLTGKEPFFEITYTKEYEDYEEDKGSYGETKTTYAINNINEYHRIINNVYILYKGRTTEIDIVLVTTKGIFVIENKNYSGWVFGDERYKYWYQTFPNGEKYRFYNPIWQNNTHIKALSEFLKIDVKYMYSYIAFSGENFKGKIQYLSDNLQIVTHENIANTIQRELYNKYAIFTPYQVDNIAMNLYKLSNVNDYVKYRHKQDIQRLKEK